MAGARDSESRIASLAPEKVWIFHPTVRRYHCELGSSDPAARDTVDSDRNYGLLQTCRLESVVALGLATDCDTHRCNGWPLYHKPFGQHLARRLLAQTLRSTILVLTHARISKRTIWAVPANVDRVGYHHHARDKSLVTTGGVHDRRTDFIHRSH